MPARSKKQRWAMAIAEHEPGKLNPENKGLLKMSKKQLHDFAKTKEKGLPMKKKKRTYNMGVKTYAKKRLKQMHGGY